MLFVAIDSLSQCHVSAESVILTTLKIALRFAIQR